MGNKDGNGYGDGGRGTLWAGDSGDSAGNGKIWITPLGCGGQGWFDGNGRDTNRFLLVSLKEDEEQFGCGRWD